MNQTHDKYCDCDECRMNQYPAAAVAAMNANTCQGCNTHIGYGLAFCHECTTRILRGRASVKASEAMAIVNAPTTPSAPEETCEYCNGVIGDECDRDCVCASCGKHGCDGSCNPSRQNYLRAYAQMIAGTAALALALTIAPPAGCTLVGITGVDEGFPVAHCADGSFVYADMDGSIDRAPGTWTDASGYALRAR